MSILSSNNQKRSLLRALGTALLAVLVLASTLVILVHPSKPTRAANSFTFTAAGDYAQTNQTTANLQYIAGSSGASFDLGLGDFNYDPTNVSAKAWSDYVKGNLGSAFPFELIAGNEDSAQLNDLASSSNLPDRIGNISGTYAKEYYFDYPPSAPLARFILASPGGIVTGYNYTKGSTHYNWVSNAIDNARSAGIPWVIVGMHEYCIDIGSDPCTAKDLTNLLLTKKVDLILYGHKHNYQVSNQLAINSQSCPTIQLNGFNQNCVVGTGTSLTKGKGSVMVITGTGGRGPLSTIDTTDPETGYFRNWEGGNVNPTWGVSRFSVSSKDQLCMQFVGVSGNFSDSFTISSQGSTPIACPSITANPTPSPAVTATPSPGTQLARDTFNRPNQSLWGTASDGQTWGGDANSRQAFSIDNNVGQVAASSSNNFNAVLGPTATDAEVLFSGSINSFTSTNFGGILRWTDGNNWYRAYIDGSSLVIQKKVNGTLTRLASLAFTATTGTSYMLRFNVVGNTLSARVWQTGTTEPSGWMVSVNDSSLSAGYCGLRVLLQSGITAQFAMFQATSQ